MYAPFFIDCTDSVAIQDIKKKTALNGLKVLFFEQ